MIFPEENIENGSSISQRQENRRLNIQDRASRISNCRVGLEDEEKESKLITILFMEIYHQIFKSNVKGKILKNNESLISKEKKNRK